MTTLILTNIDWCTEGQTRAGCNLPEAIIVLNAPDIPAADDGEQNNEDYDDLARWLDEQFGYHHRSLCIDVLGVTQNGSLRTTEGRWDVGDCAVLMYEKPADTN